MRGLLLVGCWLLVVGGAGVAQAALKGSSFLHEMSSAYVTPHHDFRGSAGEKPVKALFLLDRAGGRDAVELVERCAVEPTYFLMAAGPKIAVENMYESAWEGTTVYEKTRELDDKLSTPYDVYVFGQKTFTSVTEEHRYRILKRVRDEGAGLLIVSPQRVARMPYAKVYAEPMPESDFVRVFPSAFPKTSVKGYRLGRGRVVELSWCGYSAARYFALVPMFPVDDLWPAKYENAIAFVGQCLRYAAGRNEKPSAPVRVRWRDRLNRDVRDTMCAGTYWRDEIGANGAVTITAVTTPSPVGGLTVEVPEVSRPGERVSVRAVWKNPAPAVTSATLETLDSPRLRVMTRTSVPIPAGATQVVFDAADPRVRTKAGYFRVTLCAQDKPLDWAEAITFFPSRNTDDFMNMGWDTVLSMHPYAGYPVLIDRMGFNLGLTHPASDGSNIRAMALMDQSSVVYAWRVGLGVAANGSSQQDLWHLADGALRKRVKALKGDACFYRPEVQEIWRDAMRFRVKGLAPYAPAVYSLGDENYLKLEGGFGEYDDRYFRQFLKEKYGTIARLNANWRTNCADFASVPHLRPAVAKALGNLAAWADHRAYVEKMYADIHAFCRREIRACDPGAPVGAEGSEPGELERTIEPLEFWGPYSSLIADEVLRSFGGDRIRMLWWGGYPASHGGRGSVPFPVPLMTDLTKGTVMGNAWFDVSVGQNHAMFHPDMTLADDVRDYLEWHDRFKDGLAQLLIRNPLADEGTLFYWSHPSATAAKGSEKFLAPQDGLTTLIRSFYRTGRSFEFVSARTLARLQKAHTLFLCGATALSDDEIGAIRAFAKGGGRIVADVEPAVMNENLCSRARPALADLWDGKRAVLLGKHLSQMHAHEEKPGAFDRFLANYLPARRTYAADEPMDENAIVRTRRGPNFDLITALWPARRLGAWRRMPLGKRTFVYSPVSGFVGETNTATLDFTSVPFVCLTVFGERQHAPTFDVSPAVRGGEVKVALPPMVSGRVMTLTVKDPAGVVRWRFAFDRSEKAPRDLFVAYTDKPGMWTASLRDVATGLASERSFEVK